MTCFCPIQIVFLDCEVLFDRIPYNKLFMTLLLHYGINSSVLEVTRGFFTDVVGQVVGD